jgi:hypothetical protein
LKKKKALLIVRQSNPSLYTTRSEEIRDLYISFCAKNGFRKIGDREFTQILHREGYETKRAWYGKKNWNTVFGLTTKEAIIYEDSDEEERGKMNQIEPDKPDVSLRTPYRDLSETSGSSGSSGSNQTNPVTESFKVEQSGKQWEQIII